jgi:hypothetical protein
MRALILAALLVGASVACASAQQRTVIGYPDGTTITVETDAGGAHTVTYSNGVQVPNAQIGSGATHRGLVEVYRQSGSLILEATQKPDPQPPQDPLTETKPAAQGEPATRDEAKPTHATADQPLRPRPARRVAGAAEPRKAQARAASGPRPRPAALMDRPDRTAREVPYRRRYRYSALAHPALDPRGASRSARLSPHLSQQARQRFGHARCHDECRTPFRRARRDASATWPCSPGQFCELRFLPGPVDFRVYRVMDRLYLPW